MHALQVITSVLLILGVAGACAESTTIDGPDGMRLSVIVDLPPGDGKFPAIVLAPGQGYHMAMPVMVATARALTEQGVAVFRFNWAYFTSEPRGQPSPELSRELRDLQAVVSAARAHPRIAAQHLSVGGKSLGSVVAWRALAADRQLRSGLFLTPICSRVSKGESVPRSEAKENYPGFDADHRPTLWISGDKDPLCSPAVLYGFAASGPKTARVAIVGGDHGFENRALASSPAEAALSRNVGAVAAISAAFVAEASSHPP